MGSPISFPPEVNTTSKVPRVAVAFDNTSGVKQIPDNARKVILVGQRLATGTQPVATPLDLYRDTDGELPFGAGSVLDVAIKAAFKANPNVKLSAVAVDDAAGAAAASGTVTFAGGNATDSGAWLLLLAGRLFTAQVTTGDTPTVQGAALAAAINAVADAPWTAAAVAGVVTITRKNKGTLGNQDTLAISASVTDIGTTATLSGAVLAGGTLTPSLTAALAALSTRYDIFGCLLDDATSGGALATHLDTFGDAEHGLGQIGVMAVVGTISAMTTLAIALNDARIVVAGIRGTDSMNAEIVGAQAAVMSSETDPAKPYNTLPLPGILPPPVASRFIRTELDTLIPNGVCPLYVQAGSKVAIMRAVSTHTLNAQSATDFSELDINVIQIFDYVRDALTLMFETNYSRSKWADDEDDDLLPPDVATPKKVAIDILNTMRTLEELGIVQNVDALAPQIVVNKVGTNCQFSLPADFVQSLQEVLGKVVHMLTPFQGA